MKNLTSRILKSTLSVLIVVSMLMGMCTTLFAEGGGAGDDKKINYVSIGDSMANGYCFDGYKQDSNNLSEYNFLTGLNMYGKDAYPNQFEAYLKGVYGAGNVTHTKLAVSAMLAEDFLYLLGGREYFDDGWGGFRDYIGEYKYQDEKTQEHIQKAVSEADIMTIGIGNASFGAFLLDRITSALGVFGSSLDEDEQLDLEDALALLENEEAKQTVLKIYDELKAKILVYKDSLPSNWQLEAAIDIIVYTAASFLVNYEAMLDRIIEMNPDCEIILVGLMNTTYGMTVTGDFDTVPLGDIMDGIFSLLNAYVAGVPAAKQAAGEYSDATFYYAEQPNPLFISQEFDNLYRENWNSIDCGNANCEDCTDGDPESTCGNGRLSGAIVRNRTIDAYNSSIVPMIASMFSLPANQLKIGVSDIDEYTRAKKWVATENWGDIDSRLDGLDSLVGLLPAPGSIFLGRDVDYRYLSVVIYLSLEKAISESVDTTAIPLDGLMAIAGDLSGVFGSLTLPALDPTSKLGAIGEAARGDIDAAKELIEELQNEVASEKVREIFTNFFCSDELKPLVKVFALFKAGNGMSVHPTPTGHDNIAKAVIEAYKNKWTVQDETLKNAKVVLNIALDLIAEYYDDAYAYGYQYAKDNGYIDASVDAIDSLIATLNDLDYSDAQMTAEFKNKLDTEIEKVIDILEAAKALLVEADALDEASLNALMDLLAESEEALEGLLGLLAQAGSDIYELAIIPAVQNALYELKNTVIPAAKELAKEIAQKAYAYIVEALGEAYEDLKIIVTNAAKKYLPKLADAIYDYLYNNPEEVIEFIKTYGPYAIDVLEEYGDEALAVIGYVLYLYGEDIAALFIENHEVIFANIIAWFEVHGENTAKLIHVYAEALGLCDAVRDEIAKLKAILEDIKAAYDQASPEVKEALDKLIAQIEKQIAKLEMDVEALKAEIAAVIADVQKLIKEGKEIIAQKIAEIKAEVARLKAEAKATMEALKAEAEKAIKDLKEEVVIQLEKALDKEIETIEDLMEALDAKVAEAIDELVAIVNEIIYNATHGTYVIENDSYYLAMGDSSSFGNSYVEMLVDYLDMRKQYNNISVEGATAEDILLSLDEEIIVEILKSDLITISMSNNTFTVFAANQVAAMITGRPVKELNWSYYLSEEAQEKLYEELDSIYASFIESGMEERYADIAIFAIESFLYSYVSYLFSYTELVATIHEINPEALVVLIGMSNTFDGVVMDLGGSEFAIGEYVQNMVDAANLESFAMAIVGDNTVYVHAPDVETNFNVEEVDFLSFIMEIVLFGAENLYANEAGHEYIFGQIIEALEIHDNRGLIGDADRNGIVDMFDASLVLQYYTQEVKEEEIDLYVSDVDGNGEVDMFDASLILQYYTGEIAVFPVEE